jgi:hypothetical protein
MVSEQIQSPVRYPSDLIDEEWKIIEAIISELDPYTTGRVTVQTPRRVNPNGFASCQATAGGSTGTALPWRRRRSASAI